VAGWLEGGGAVDVKSRVARLEKMPSSTKAGGSVPSVPVDIPALASDLQDAIARARASGENSYWARSMRALGDALDGGDADDNR